MSDFRSTLVIHCIRLADGYVVLDAEHACTSSPCPSCGTQSDRVHGAYQRQPYDLPWRGQPVRLRLTVKRFRCENTSCERQTFAEDFGVVLPRYARCTAAVTAFLRGVALTLGGEAGARIARACGIGISPDTLIRLLRGPHPAELSTPRVLGVDDFALRRGNRYATLLVDLETHRPVDVLKDREADTLASWLRAHPGVEIVSRDRSYAYADGARRGAPTAVQVADRFHLVQNAGAALEDLLRGRRQTVEYARGLDPAPDQAAPIRVPSPTALRKQKRRTDRLARFEQVRALHAAGVPKKRIARELGVARKTVRRWILASGPPQGHVPPEELERPRPGGLDSPMLQPYLAYLQDRWQQGCTNASRLFHELLDRGYQGSYSLIRARVHAWRIPRAPPVRRRRRSAKWLCLRPRERLGPEEQEALDHLLTDDAEVARGYDLLQRFRTLVRARDGASLEGWLADAQSSALPAFVAFANGILADRAAVDAALSLPWSNGPVEGHIHRLKLIKRQGYGRAKLDLLKTRVLAA